MPRLILPKEKHIEIGLFPDVKSLPAMHDLNGRLIPSTPPDAFQVIAKGEIVPGLLFGNEAELAELVDGAHRAITEITIELHADPWPPFWVGGRIRASTPLLTPPPNSATVIPYEQHRTVSRGRWRGTYAEYTATPEFQKIAARARKDWGYRCLLNANHTGPVEMHHRTYADVPFQEDWHTLIPLCEECHERHHGRLPKPPRGLFDEIEIKRAA